MKNYLFGWFVASVPFGGEQKMIEIINNCLLDFYGSNKPEKKLVLQAETEKDRDYGQGSMRKDLLLQSYCYLYLPYQVSNGEIIVEQDLLKKIRQKANKVRIFTSAIMSEEEIAKLLSVEKDEKKVENNSIDFLYLSPGENVRIIKGPFKGFRATFYLTAKKGYSIVLIKIFNRNDVKLTTLNENILYERK